MELDRLEQELGDRLSERSRVSRGTSILDLHGRDESIYNSRPPDIVVFPVDVEEVAAVVALAAAERIPIVPYGAGTSIGGKTLPVHGGICLDMSRMDTVIEISPDEFLAVVQPGVLRSSLERRAAEHGLFFSVDPGADATLGGMAATNASGTTTVRYGSMRSNVRALQVVFADGSIARTGTRAPKSSAGYDLTGILVGSEGTLGVITELTLRLHPIPERIVSARASFADLRDACWCAVEIVRSDLGVSRLELLDGPSVKIVNEHFGSDHDEFPTLFIELGGAEGFVDTALTALANTANACGCREMHTERDPTRQRRLWHARHSFGVALAARNPGRTVTGTDSCVPVPELPDAITSAQRLLAEAGLTGDLAAHAGDGNFHMSVGVDRSDPTSVAAFERFNTAVSLDAVARGGTVTGEHGIGLSAGLLAHEHGDLLPWLRAIKEALDPAGILNPGKLFAPDAAVPI